MPHTRTAPTNRRGIATLEFVLVFPFLLALVAGIFLVARADAGKALSATAARNEAWRKRPGANPGDILSPWNDPITSAVSATPQRPVAGGWWFRSANLTASTQATATGRTWDHRDIRFESGRGFMNPHLDELGMIAKGVVNLRGVVNKVRDLAGKLIP